MRQDLSVFLKNVFKKSCFEPPFGSPGLPGGRLGLFPTASGGQLSSAPHRRPHPAGLEWMALRFTQGGGARKI